MPRPTNTDARRKQIVTGMAAVVAKHGYDGASVAEIAKAAGLTPGLVHYHFETKLEIFVSLIDTVLSTLQERVQRHVEAAATPRQKLNAFIDAHLALNSDADPQLVACWSVIGVEAIRQEPVREAFRRVVEWEIESIQRLLTETLPPDRAEAHQTRAHAAALFAVIEGYFLLAAAAPEAIPRGSAATAVRAMAAGLLQS